MNKYKYIKDLIGSQDKCPGCGYSFIGEDIYKFFLAKGETEERAYEIAKNYGYTHEKPRYFRKDVLIETPNYDGGSFYMCPNCTTIWRRFAWVKEKDLPETQEILAGFFV